MNARPAAVVALLVLVGGLAAPSSAQPVAALPAGADLRPGAVAVVGPDGRLQQQHRPLDALLQVRDHRDTGAWLRSRAAAGRLLSNDTTTTSTSAPLVADPDAFAVSVPAGDLDGDGREDLLTYAFRGAGGELRARRGADGAPLWTRPLAGDDGALAFALGRDLTGDGVDDLLVDELLVHDQGGTVELGLVEGGYRYRATWTNRLAVLSGADGRVAWERRSPGRLEESYEYAGDPVGVVQQGTYRLRSTGLALFAQRSDSVDGDGLSDLVVNEVDLDVDAEGVDATVAYDGTERTRSTTRAQVLRGATGSSLLDRTATDVAGLGLLLPLGQVTGGPAADLLWDAAGAPDQDVTCAVVVGCPGLAAPSSTLELLDPERPDSPVWRSTASGTPFAQPAGDVDGDGAPDVVRDNYDAGTDTGVLEVLSGRDGRVLWRVQEPGLPQLLVAVEGATAVTASFLFDDELEVVLTRRDRATGAPRSSERVPVRQAPAPPGEHALVVTFTSLFVGALPDGDLDGRRELEVGALSTTYAASGEDEDEDERRDASQWRYAPLVGGAPLLSVVSDDLRVLDPTGDLDGDGAQDVVQAEIVLDEGLPVAVSTGTRLRDAVDLWHAEDPLDERPHGAGDQDGQPGVELVQDRAGDRLESRSGADLGLRWSR